MDKQPFDRHLGILTTTSGLAILFTSFHLADDVVRGFEPGGFKNVIGILTLVVWLYGTLVLTGRPSGYVIVLLGSLLGFVIPLAHMMGKGLVGGQIANSSGMFFWVWALLALGVSAGCSLVLTTRALWKREWRRSRPMTTSTVTPLR